MSKLKTTSKPKAKSKKAAAKPKRVTPKNTLTRPAGVVHTTDALLKAMIEAAWASGEVIRSYFGKVLRIREKLGAGLVTEADTNAEKAALKILQRARPDFELLAEESSPIPSSGAQSRLRQSSLGPGAAPKTLEGEGHGRWIMDPLDGTTNFIHGFPMFCVSIAAEWKGQIIAGVIYHPIFEETYTAILGSGAFLNRKRMQVSKTDRLKDTLLTTGFSYRKDQWLHAEMEAFERLSAVARAIRRPGSAALDLAYTARGIFDGFWERRLSAWDVAAGALLVQEAGGMVTDFQGDPFRIDALEILASNRGLHQDLLDTVAPEICPIVSK